MHGTSRSPKVCNVMGKSPRNTYSAQKMMPPNFNYIIINQGQSAVNSQSMMQLTGGAASLQNNLNSASAAAEGIIAGISGQLNSNILPMRKISITDTPRNNATPHGNFQTPTVVNHSKIEGGNLQNSQGPSVEVTPTNFLMQSNSHHGMQNLAISKHNSFYDECLRLNAGNTASALHNSRSSQNVRQSLSGANKNSSSSEQTSRERDQVALPSASSQQHVLMPPIPGRQTENNSAVRVKETPMLI